MRRTVKPLLLVSSIFFCCILSAAPALALDAKGVVFEDLNHNGVLDAGEPGVAGVLVSNQLDVVKTDAQGKYTIPVHNEITSLFVVKPNGYTTPMDDNNLPRFFYLHQPQGSPELKYKGLDPTGDLPESVNFPLNKVRSSNSFDVLVFSDPQPRDNREIDFIRDDVIAELANSEQLFGITLGDIMFDDLSLFGRYNEIVSKVGIPFYNVPGNHDMNYDAAVDLYSLETFKRHYGPYYYAWEEGMVNFIALDSVYWEINPETKKGGYIGKLGDEQLQWVENYLTHVPDDHLIVFALHIPLYFSQSNSRTVNVEDRERLFDVVKDRKHLLAIAGHMHEIEQVAMNDGIGRRSDAPFPMITCAAVCGAWWSGPIDERGIPETTQKDGAPNGYHIFHFRGNRFTQEFRAVNRNAAYQLRISSPTGTVESRELPDLQVVANVFNADTDAVVEYRMGDGPAVRMTNTEMVDPHMVSYHHSFETLIPNWIKPSVTNHIWTAPLPDGLEPGVHEIVVSVIDQYGNHYEGARIFEVK